MSVGLKDINREPIVVEIGDQKIAIKGISARGVAMLVERFPVLYAMLAERRVELKPNDLFKLGPELVSAVIASGLGKPGDVEEETLAGELAVGEQFDLIVAILKRTFHRGLGPFMEELEAGAAQIGAYVATGKAPVTKSPSRSNGASPQDTTQTSPGNILHESLQPGPSSSAESVPKPEPTS